MSDISERDILDNIKKSIESETPEVWDKIKEVDECRFDPEKKPIKPKSRKAYFAATAAACVLIAVSGLEIKNFISSKNNGEILAYSHGQGSATSLVAPGAPQDSAGRDVKTGTAEIYNPFTKDADVNEASTGLKFQIAEPSWLPDGFSKASSQLLSMNQDGSRPYMYTLVYCNTDKKMISINVTKYMTEEEKVKAQPAPMPMPEPAEKGSPESTGGSSADSGKGSILVPPTPPDATPQSVPGYSPSQPAIAPNAAEKPSDTPLRTDTPQASGNSSSAVSSNTTVSSGGSAISGSTAVSFGGSTGSSGAGISDPGATASVQFTSVKVKGTDVSLTFTSGSENSTVSANWAYNGGNYYFYSDSIPKDDMIKIIESMIK
ncbi:MAG: hypothetical protein Q8930_06245 [Bacillota bacterium]|nr:hypothetical protein [Bacillota bacterium]